MGIGFGDELGESVGRIRLVHVRRDGRVEREVDWVLGVFDFHDGLRW